MSAALPLTMAYRMSVSWEQPIGRGLMRRADADKLMESNLFDLLTKKSGYDYLTLRAGVSRPGLRRLTDELAASAPSGMRVSDLELTAAVLARGDMPGTYGNSFWGDEKEKAFHVFACGIDWGKYVGVRSTTWHQWNGTFDEGQEQQRIEASVACMCGDVKRVQFGLEPPSLADLYRALSSDHLEELFQV